MSWKSNKKNLMYDACYVFSPASHHSTFAQIIEKCLCNWLGIRQRASVKERIAQIGHWTLLISVAEVSICVSQLWVSQKQECQWKRVQLYPVGTHSTMKWNVAKKRKWRDGNECVRQTWWDWASQCGLDHRVMRAQMCAHTHVRTERMCARACGGWCEKPRIVYLGCMGGGYGGGGGYNII